MAKRRKSNYMKQLVYGLVGTLLYVAPLIAIILQVKGTKTLCAELQGIRTAIENLQTEREENDGRTEDIYYDDSDIHWHCITDWWELDPERTFRYLRFFDAPLPVE